MDKRFSQCKHWIFDLDGTLTLAVHDFVHMRRQLDIPMSEDILGHIAALPESEKRAKSECLEELEYFYAKKAQPAPGVDALIAYLHRSGCQLAILTRNSKVLAHLSLDAIGLNHFFDGDLVLGRDEALPKPHPQGIHTIKKSWGIDHEPVVMVGDFRFDLEAGRNAECLTIHVHRDEALQWPELTDFRAASLSEITQYLQKET